MKQSITINWAWVGVYVLLAAILGVSLYAPHTKTAERSISVEGSSTIKAEPDSFEFSPQFEIAANDQAKAKEAVAAKSTEVVGKLKALGVEDKDIKLNANQYDKYPQPVEGRPIEDQQTTSVSLTITIQGKALAQKVQNYLATTDAKGQLTPQPTFSKTQQDALTRKAEVQAVADARRRADALASNLDAKRGKVLSVTNQNNTQVRNYAVMGVAEDAKGTPSIPIQPGTNEFSYSVSVKFALQ